MSYETMTDRVALNTRLFDPEQDRETMSDRVALNTRLYDPVHRHGMSYPDPVRHGMTR